MKLWHYIVSSFSCAGSMDLYIYIPLSHSTYLPHSIFLSPFLYLPLSLYLTFNPPTILIPLPLRLTILRSEYENPMIYIYIRVNRITIDLYAQYVVSYLFVHSHLYVHYSSLSSHHCPQILKHLPFQISCLVYISHHTP